MTFRLLALDGGGIRGYMTAKILHQLEKETGASFISDAIVDGYSGTSTGGLLAIGLANEHSPEKLAALYKSKAKDIFSPNHNRDLVLAIRALAKAIPGLLDLIEGVGTFSSQYIADGLQDVAKELVGDKIFGDFDEKRVLAVNTTAMKVPDTKEGWTSTTMCNHALPRSRIGDSRRIKQIDGALSTSAAPSYFPPHHVIADGQSLGFFADGGLFANNPVMNGITVAMAAGLAKPEDFEVISIGTGIDETGIGQGAFKDPLEFGILEWMGLQKKVPPGALLSITMTASADNMTWISSNLLQDRMVRLNPTMKPRVELDGTSAKDFAIMDQAVETLFADKEKWDPAVTMARSWAGSAGA